MSYEFLDQLNNDRFVKIVIHLISEEPDFYFDPNRFSFNVRVDCDYVTVDVDYNIDEIQYQVQFKILLRALVMNWSLQKLNAAKYENLSEYLKAVEKAKKTRDENFDVWLNETISFYLYSCLKRLNGLIYKI